MTTRPASDFARIAELSYQADWPCIAGKEDGSARAKVQHLDGQQLIAVPGTDNIACWLADLDALATDTPNFGKVHLGFFKAAMSIQNEVIHSAPDILVGHSEGADLVLLLAAACAMANRKLLTVYAFEPARLCVDDKLKTFFASSQCDVRIYQHGNDIVTMVPRLLQPWRHPTDKLWQFGAPHVGLVEGNVGDHLLGKKYCADLDKAGF